MGATSPVWLTLLVAFLTGTAGIVGALGGQLVARRTTREQLKATRDRDRELWAREDRHRFTEQKRCLYAELLASYMHYAGPIVNARYEIQRYLDKLPGDETMTPAAAEQYHRFVDEKGYERAILPLLADFENSLSAVELVAPNHIGVTARAIDKCLLESLASTIGACDLETSGRSMKAADELRKALREQMRVDLADRASLLR